MKPQTRPFPAIVAAIIEKYGDYCACDEYHYGEINGMPGNHDPSDGHQEFDEEEATQAILQAARQLIEVAMPEKVKILPGMVTKDDDGEAYDYWGFSAGYNHALGLYRAALLDGLEGKE